MFTAKQLQNFWKKVDKSGDCWLWTASKNIHGYGKFNINGKMKSSHRVSCEIENGPIADGLCCLHKCDNPRCVRPSHLFIGTYADNMADMSEKGRCNKTDKARGEKQGNAKLDEKSVLEIRSLHKSGAYTQQKISEIYLVSPSRISEIVNKISWAHI